VCFRELRKAFGNAEGKLSHLNKCYTVHLSYRSIAHPGRGLQGGLVQKQWFPGARAPYEASSAGTPMLTTRATTWDTLIHKTGRFVRRLISNYPKLWLTEHLSHHCIIHHCIIHRSA